MSDVDDALDRLAGDLRSHADVYTYLDRDKDAAAVREELQRLREERDAGSEENYAGYGPILEELTNRAEAADAEAQRLREGLRPFAKQPCGKFSPSWDGPEFVPCGECKTCIARALLSASPPPLPCGHPESSVVSADEGTAYCGECASPPDGDGAK